jgi:hypothetical protein
MDLKHIENRAMLWWNFCDSDRVLVRVILLGREFIVCQVLAATVDQVLASGYGVGETCAVKAAMLDRLKAS